MTSVRSRESEAYGNIEASGGGTRQRQSGPTTGELHPADRPAVPGVRPPTTPIGGFVPRPHAVSLPDETAATESSHEGAELTDHQLKP